MKAKIFLILIFILAILVRSFRLLELPGEWYGDISNVHEYVMEILAGKWPFYFIQSPGPFYHYLIAPLIAFLPYKGYLSYKIASAIVSNLGLLSFYFFVKEFKGVKIALISLVVASISFWYLVWSRLGNSQIVIPLIWSFQSIFFIRYLRNLKIKNLVFTAIIAALGWYTYPQSFIFPVFIFIFTFIFIVYRLRKTEFWQHFGVLILVTILGFIPMIFIFYNPVNDMYGNFGRSGYVGKKVLPVFSMSKKELIMKLTGNLGKTIVMLHVAGDESFRVNVSGKPQIDLLSGILFFAGLIYLLRSKKRLVSLYILLSLLILLMPSISPAILDREIPNSARTIAIIPIVYLFVTLGIWQIYLLLKVVVKKRLAALFTAVLIVIIAQLNLSDYFKTYAGGLPENNLGPSRYISTYIDKNIPINVNLYFAECCWGNWGEPEPKAIYYQLRKPRRMANYNKIIESCEEIVKPAIVVTRGTSEINENIRNCLSGAIINEIYTENSVFISQLYYLK